MSVSTKILVCVTQQKTCARLIKAAADLRDETEGQLFVLHVAKSQWSFLDNQKEGEALEYLFGISKSTGADMTVLRSEHIVETIADFIREHGIETVIVGQSPSDHKENHFIHTLKKLVSSVEIKAIPPE